MIKHEGKWRHRLKDHLLERVLAEQWQEINSGEGRGHGPLAYMLAEDRNRPKGEVSDRDAVVAATVIQWLGTPVGQGFLEDVWEKSDG